MKNPKHKFKDNPAYDFTLMFIGLFFAFFITSPDEWHTPFRYSRIIFGLAIGVFLFDESISLSSVLGCILVVMSSLVVLSSTRQDSLRL